MSSNDLREIPPHMASTPKSESIAPPILGQNTNHAEEELHEAKLESQSHLSHQDEHSRKPEEDYSP